MKNKVEKKEMPPILIRLQEFVDKMNLSIYQINKEAGLCKGLLTNAYTKRQGLTATTLEALLTAYPQLNANWLIVGRGNMLNEEAVQPTQPQQDPCCARQHIENLDVLQQQCVEMLRNIQQMKQKEQADADANLLRSLGL